MSIDFQDGGAFAECFFVQYPKGLGRQPIAPATVSRLEHLQPAGSSFPSAATPSETAAPRAVSSSSLALTVVSSADIHRKQQQQQDGSQLTDADKEEALARTAARTRQALEATLETKNRNPQQALSDDAFDGRRFGKSGSSSSTSLTIVTTAVNAAADGSNAAASAPIVRSPTKAPKRSVLEVDALKKKAAAGHDESGVAEEDAPSLSASGGVSVPFAVGNWRNKNNLIIPVEQRLAQQRDERTTSAGIGSRIVALAMAMRQAEKGVGQELKQRATARAQEEERKQAAIEEEEMKKAKRLMEENAARLAQQQQQQNRRGETREQRLERLRLERELREREKEQKQRQRQLAKAAARLNMRVEDLEADENLLQALERGEASSGLEGQQQQQHPHRPATSSTSADALLQPGSGAFKRETAGAEDEDDGEGPARRAKSSYQMFMRPVVSNEGIAREMETLAALERDGLVGGSGGGGGAMDGGHGRSDGIKLPEADGDDKDDDDDDMDEDRDDAEGGFAMEQLVRKRQRLL